MKQLILTPINSSMKENSFEILKNCLSRRASERGGIVGEGGYTMTFRKDGEFVNGRFTLISDNTGVILTAGSDVDLHAAAGRFLRECTFDGEGGFAPPDTYMIDFTPKNELRGMYFATHFHNFYQTAPYSEVHEVIEDLALSGCNALLVWYDMHHFHDIDEPASVRLIDRLHDFLAYAGDIGMSGSLTMLSNEAFASSPEKLRAEWAVQGDYTSKPNGHYHVEICPNKDGGIEEILRERRIMLSRFSDLDIKYVVFWPYDQGGCTCSACSPWGANGFIKTLEAFRPLLSEVMPNTEIIISTWYFDKFIKGEWDAFYKRLSAGEFSFAPYILSFFFNGDLPDCINENGIPDGVKFIEFPEISMYTCVPWGGFGANPLSRFIDRTAKGSGSLYSGSFPYSEGVFEDINKYITLSLSSGRFDNAADAVRDYCRFEFCRDSDCEALADAVIKTETALSRKPYNDGTYQHYDISDTSDIEYVYETISRFNDLLPERIKASRRWRLIYLRAVIDKELKDNGFLPLKSARCQEAMKELYSLYHSDEKTLTVVKPPFGI